MLLVARVPAGLTAMQALERKTNVKTSYGGRFVVAIGGLASSSHHDWFYWVNGTLADRSAARARAKLSAPDFQCVHLSIQYNLANWDAENDTGSCHRTSHFRPISCGRRILKLVAQELAAWCSFQRGSSETHIFKPFRAC